MSNSIFSSSRYLKKTVTTALILGLMISPILPATQSISSSISIAAQATRIETQAEEAQAANGDWSQYANTAWYNANPNASSYILTTADQLAGLAQLVNDGTCDFAGKTIKLNSNINLGEHYWIPIGNVNKTFKGTFDGKGFTIDNMKIGQDKNTPENCRCAGLFGNVSGATISNVIIGENSIISVISAFDSNAAGIVANAENSTINSCKNYSVVYSRYDMVTSGIAARIKNSKVINCCNYGKIRTTDTGDPTVAGIVGQAEENSEIMNCINLAKVSSRCNAAGKIAGIVSFANDTKVKNCVNIGKISTSSEKGSAYGIATLLYGANDNNETMKNYYLEESAQTGFLDSTEGNKFTALAFQDIADIIDDLNDVVADYNDENPEFNLFYWSIDDSGKPVLIDM